MRKKASIAIAVMLVCAVAVAYAGDSSQACDKAAAAKTAGACCKKGAAAVAGTGCTKGAAAKTAGATCTKGAAAKTAGATCTKGTAAKTASVADIRGHEGTRVVLTGNAVCGKCNLGISEACQSFFQTADGKVYRLIKNNHVKAMRDAQAKNGFRIVSYVRKLEGAKYLDVQHVKTL
ncbi:MAG: hypothetical protein ACE5EO_01535 [Candidatus Krumholzibacteriia bacterium]